FVLATQNPIEQEGTYPLPEAQLDRFMFMVMVGYPSLQDEVQIMQRTTVSQTGDLQRIMNAEDILHLQEIVRRVPVADHVFQYALRLTRATRAKTSEAAEFINEWVTWGAGPRARHHLILGAKARAILDVRTYVTCDAVAFVAPPGLGP